MCNVINIMVIARNNELGNKNNLDNICTIGK